MSLLKSPKLNALFIGIMSIAYSFLYIFTSDHIEFLGQLNFKTLDSSFWNGWGEFIKSGNMKYVGYGILCMSIIIVLITLIKHKKAYDEYQFSILSKSLSIAGILSVVVLPFMMILYLSDPNYGVPIFFLFSVIQWVSVLITNLVYVIKC